MLIRKRMLEGTSPLPSSIRDSTRFGHRHNIHDVSWDIQRAYHFLSKTYIKLAWMRLGIPPYIADYLIAIESEGKTLIRSMSMGK